MLNTLLETPCAPVSFRDAWTVVMSRPKVRNWLFNKAPPTPLDLMRSRSNQPLMKGMMLSPQDVGETGKTFSDRLYLARLEELYVHAYKLRCGTELGFVLNMNDWDVAVPMFSSLNKCFTDPTTNVIRLAAGTAGRRLFLIDFSWLRSGGLLIRYIPCGAPLPSLSPEMTAILPEVLAREGHRIGNALGCTFVYAFSSANAAKLAAAARDPTPAFLNARLDLLGLSEDCYCLSVFDTGFQAPCIFCLSRGSLSCKCPMPLRRRAVYAMESRMAIYVHRDTSVPLWAQFCSAMSCSHRKGSFIYNMRKNISPGKALVVDSGLMPFNFNIAINYVNHPSLQLKVKQSSPLNGCRTSLFSELFDSELLNSGTSSSDNSNSAEVPFRVTIGDKHQKRIRTSPYQSPSNFVSPMNFSPENESPELPSPENGTSGHSVIENGLSLPPFKDECAARSTADPAEVEGARVRVFNCPICGIEIKSKRSNLKRHIENKHHNVRNFECEYCGNRFHTLLNLKRHIRSKHKAREDQNTSAVEPEAQNNGLIPTPQKTITAEHLHN